MKIVERRGMMRVKEFLNSIGVTNVSEFNNYKDLKTKFPFVLRQLNFNQLSEDRKNGFMGFIIPNSHMKNSTYYVFEENNIPTLLIEKSGEDNVVRCTMNGEVYIENIVFEDNQYVLDKVGVIVEAPPPIGYNEIVGELANPVADKARITELVAGDAYLQGRAKLMKQWYSLPPEDRKKFDIVKIQNALGKTDGMLDAIKNNDLEAFEKLAVKNSDQVSLFIKDQPKQKSKGGNTMGTKAEVKTYLQGVIGNNKSELDAFRADLDTTVMAVEGAFPNADPAEVRQAIIEALDEISANFGSNGSQGNQDNHGNQGSGEGKDPTLLSEEEFAKQQEQILSTIRSKANVEISQEVAKVYDLFKNNALLHLFTTEKNESLAVQVSTKNFTIDGKKVPFDPALEVKYAAAKKQNPKAKTVLIEGKEYKDSDIYKRIGTLKFRIQKPSTPFGAVVTIPKDLLTLNVNDVEEVSKVLSVEGELPKITKVLYMDQLNTILLRFGSRIKEDMTFAVKFYDNKGNLVKGEGVYETKLVSVPLPKPGDDTNAYLKKKRAYKPQKPVLLHNGRDKEILTYNNFIPLKRHVRTPISKINTPEDLKLYNNALFGNLYQLGKAADKRKPINNIDILNAEQAKLFQFDADSSTVSSEFIKNGDRVPIKAKHYSRFNANGEKLEETITMIEQRRYNKSNRVEFEYETLQGADGKGYTFDDLKYETADGKLVPLSKLLPQITPMDVHNAYAEYKEYRKSLKPTTTASFGAEQASAIYNNLADASKYIAGVQDYSKLLATLR